MSGPRDPAYWWACRPPRIYTDPAVCAHPVEARVTPAMSYYLATCHDCRLSLRRDGRWEVALLPSDAELAAMARRRRRTLP